MVLEVGKMVIYKDYEIYYCCFGCNLGFVFVLGVFVVLFMGLMVVKVIFEGCVLVV